MSKEILTALYEQHRLSILNAFMQFGERRLPAGLAYAYDARVAPVFHQAIQRETYGFDPYEQIYAVPPMFVDEVSDYLDKKWKVKDWDAVAFSALENHFGGYKAKRMELVHTLTYLYISDLYDEELWRAVMKSAPVEAQGINRGFSPDDISFE